MKGDEYLKEILDFYRFKLDEGTCGMDDIESLTKVLEQNMELSGTVSDFAKFYGVSESNVRLVIHRNLLEKPKRRVHYSFNKFLKAVPEKWRILRNQSK